MREIIHPRMFSSPSPSSIANDHPDLSSSTSNVTLSSQCVSHVSDGGTSSHPHYQSNAPSHRLSGTHRRSMPILSISADLLSSIPQCVHTEGSLSSAKLGYGSSLQSKNHRPIDVDNLLLDRMPSDTGTAPGTNSGGRSESDRNQIRYPIHLHLVPEYGFETPHRPSPIQHIAPRKAPQSADDDAKGPSHRRAMGRGFQSYDILDIRFCSTDSISLSGTGAICSLGTYLLCGKSLHQHHRQLIHEGIRRLQSPPGSSRRCIPYSLEHELDPFNQKFSTQRPSRSLYRKKGDTTSSNKKPVIHQHRSTTAQTFASPSAPTTHSFLHPHVSCSQLLPRGTSIRPRQPRSH